MDEDASTGRYEPLPAAFALAPEQQHPLNVVGEHIAVLASGVQTGSYEIFRQHGPEGSGPPPHTHPWTESFYVIRGDVEFTIDDHDGVARPGTLVNLPAGTVHCFRFGAGGGEMLSIAAREGASHLFAELDREIRPDRPDFVKLVEISNRHELTIFEPSG
jgi:quercetin dioxygenase-like cupin family protein